MAFSRIAAMCFVFVLIGSLALAGVGAVAVIGPALAHGTQVEHEDGNIIQIGPGTDFVLATASGQRLRFQCGSQCRASLAHLQRHLREHAHTDVYYMHGPGGSLVALDVD